MTIPLTEREDFRAVLACAKRLSKTFQGDVLDERLFLSSLWMIRYSDEIRPHKEFIKQHEQALSEVAQEFRGCLPAIDSVSPEFRLKLTDGIEIALDVCEEPEEDPLRQFIKLLIAFVEDDPLARVYKECEMFRGIIDWAEAGRRQARRPLICPMSLAMGSYRAALSGSFDEYPHYLRWIMAHTSAFECLSKKSDRHFGPNVPLQLVGSEIIPPISPIVRSRLEGEPDRVESCIKFAIDTAVRFLTRRLSAFHEAGHAVTIMALRPDMRIKSVSVEETQDCYGQVEVVEDPSKSPITTNSIALYHKILTLLAGREAEQLAEYELGMNSGAIVDLRRSTELAWQYIAEYGFDSEFGPVNLKSVGNRSGEAAAACLHKTAGERLQELLRQAQSDAARLVHLLSDAIHEIACRLEECGRLYEVELATLPTVRSLKPSECLSFLREAQGNSATACLRRNTVERRK